MWSLAQRLRWALRLIGSARGALHALSHPQGTTLCPVVHAKHVNILGMPGHRQSELHQRAIGFLSGVMTQNAFVSCLATFWQEGCCHWSPWPA